MTDITITHTMAEGTLVEGDPRPHHQILKDAGFRWSRNVGWYIRNSRDRQPQTWRINQAAENLRKAGFEVTVDIDATTRPIEEREADRAERLEDRQDALDAKAGKLALTATSRFGAASQISDMIPLGQPILVGHHSEGRHRRDLARIERNIDRGMEASKASTEAERKANASRSNQSHHESGPATLRRIERLETEKRDIERKIAGKPCPTAGIRLKPEFEGVNGEWSCRLCGQKAPITDDHKVGEHFSDDLSRPASGAWLDNLTARKTDVEAEIVYWQAHIDTLKEEGFRLWGPADFKKGDIVNGSVVVRVNKKSLSVESGYSWTLTLPYDGVVTHRSAKKESDAVHD